MCRSFPSNFSTVTPAYDFFETQSAILENPAVDICEISILRVNGVFLPVARISIKKTFHGDTFQLLKDLHSHCVETLPPNSVPCAYQFLP